MIPHAGLEPILPPHKASLTKQGQSREAHGYSIAYVSPAAT